MLKVGAKGLLARRGPYKGMWSRSLDKRLQIVVRKGDERTELIQEARR